MKELFAEKLSAINWDPVISCNNKMKHGPILKPCLQGYWTALLQSGPKEFRGNVMGIDAVCLDLGKL